ncbi:Uu.00g071520.m01.CDS01 [Anthostomella pinea]|uniref:Uu.00g071520.m01.CDS01 n=1 Tax=Anthostomella pinea TaxID=933095 RepID=A0AAI8VUW9_9PEZI|nr:Uu.00g071520.m01.CDS01 [Anthostomella pinea]
MSSPVAELEAGLIAMQNLKAPGVSGSRIQSLTTLCVTNVQSESVLIQKIYTHFKKVPATHKLGVLYVVDSVTRRWVDHAKQQGQPINSSAQDGTYAAGVHRVTELLPVLMNDILQNAPGEQKEKIKKLVDIWEKGQTFPAPMIESFKQKMNTAPLKTYSTTPIGSPPPGPGLPGLSESKPPTTEAPNAIMEALANIARQNITAAPASNPVPVPAYSYNAPAPPAQTGAMQQPVLPMSYSQPPAPTPPPAPYAAAAPPVNAPGMPYSFQQQGYAHSQPFSPQVAASSQAPGFPGVAHNAPPPAAAGGMDPNVQQQVMLIKILAEQGVPVDKIPAIIAGMQGTGAAPPIPQPAQPSYGGWGQEGFRPDESRDHNFHQVRSPNRFRNRSRSRSPPRNWDQRGSPRGREFGAYGGNSPGPGRMDDRDRRGRGPDYRQRSPPGRRGRSPSPPQGYSHPSAKWIDFDRSVPQGHIKVLSRTLFVGGVTCPEGELRAAFGRHGQVQTCIVNKDKRHAFVKMVNRRDAIAAKEGMENSTYRTRWGVGFGPRDCSDYQTGISIIPITKLTEADRKWMLTAEYGGSGGQPIESGMVVEEPDIEIGAGVSSKAISRRMQTDKGGRHGPKSSRGGFGGDDDGDLTRWRRNRDHRRDDQRDEMMSPAQSDGPQFPFGISTGPNGMPMFPPGFSFPAPDQYNGSG